MKNRKTTIPSIEEWFSAQQAAKTARQEQLVSFLALKSQIMEYMEKGFTLKTIHEYLTSEEVQRLNCHYDTFRRYVKKYVTQVPAPVTAAQQPTQEPRPVMQPTSSTPAFNWSPTPNPKDLL